MSSKETQTEGIQTSYGIQKRRGTNREKQKQRESMEYIKKQLEPRGTRGGFVALQKGLQPAR